MQTRRSTIAGAVLAVLFVLITSAACERRGEDAESKGKETQTTGATQEKPTSVAAVKDNAEQFYGKRVTLSGEVEDVSGDARTFKLEGEGPFGGIFGREIYVLTRGPVKMGGAQLAEDDKVLVTGTVRRFVVADVERELGWDLSNEVEVVLREKPVLIADEIRRIEPSSSWSAKSPEGEIVSTVILVTAPRPDDLVGQRIGLERAKVQSVSGKGVWIGPSHSDQTFVLPSDGADLSAMKPGDLVDVRGTVRKMPPAAEALKKWNLPATMRGVVEGEALYIEASELEPAKAKQNGDPKSNPKSGRKGNTGTR